MIFKGTYPSDFSGKQSANPRVKNSQNNNNNNNNNDNNNNNNIDLSPGDLGTCCHSNSSERPSAKTDEKKLSRSK